MFEAQIQARAGSTEVMISKGTGKTAAKAIDEACVAMEQANTNADRFACRVFEDGSEIFWAFGDTAMGAADEAKRMNNKSRRGGGR